MSEARSPRAIRGQDGDLQGGRSRWRGSGPDASGIQVALFSAGSAQAKGMPASGEAGALVAARRAPSAWTTVPRGAEVNGHAVAMHRGIVACPMHHHLTVMPLKPLHDAGWLVASSPPAIRPCRSGGQGPDRAGRPGAGARRDDPTSVLPPDRVQRDPSRRHFGEGVHGRRALKLVNEVRKIPRCWTSRDLPTRGSPRTARGVGDRGEGDRPARARPFASFPASSSGTSWRESVPDGWVEGQDDKLRGRIREDLSLATGPLLGHRGSWKGAALNGIQIAEPIRGPESTTARTIRLTLAYDGDGFHGWQTQPALLTVQGLMAGACHRIPVRRRASLALVVRMPARTRSGRWRASRHVLHRHAWSERGLNALLPPAIRVVDAGEALVGFQRRTASGKRYAYVIDGARYADPSSPVRLVHFWP